LPRKKSPTLTEAELRLMEVLWERGESTVNDVVDALPPGSPLAYSSVLTTLRILDQKGYVRHQKRGRAFLYSPVIAREEAQRSAVRFVMSRFFENSPEMLVLNVLENDDLSPEELKRLRQMIEDAD